MGANNIVYTYSWIESQLEHRRVDGIDIFSITPGHWSFVGSSQVLQDVDVLVGQLDRIRDREDDQKPTCIGVFFKDIAHTVAPFAEHHWGKAPPGTRMWAVDQFKDQAKIAWEAYGPTLTTGIARGAATVLGAAAVNRMIANGTQFVSRAVPRLAVSAVVGLEFKAVVNETKVALRGQCDARLTRP